MLWRLLLIGAILTLTVLLLPLFMTFEGTTLAPSENSRFASVQGTQLHYQMSGPETGTPVLVLHGASSNLFEPRLGLEDAFSGQRVIWLDRPGLGWSKRPEGPWSPEHEAGLITAFLDHLEIEDVILIGHSWGGAISMRIMIDHPERVRGAVLVAPALRAWVGEAAFYNKLTHWPVLGPIITNVIAPKFGPGQLAGGVQSAFSPEPVPEGYIESARLDQLFTASVWRANAADMAYVNLHLEAQETRYSELTQPIIFIAGPGDTVVRTDRHSVPVSETVQNGELRLIEDAGHNPHHAHAVQVRQAVDDVLARSERP